MITLHNTRLKATLCLLIITACWLSGLFWFVRHINTQTTPDNVPKAAAIVVLTGGSNRLETGFQLFKQEKGDKLFISGVHKGIEIETLLKLSRQESDARTNCCITIGNAGNTIENAAETYAWLQKERLHSFYLVTANYHMKRALLEFYNIAPELNITPWPVTPKSLDIKHWWKNKSTAMLIMREYTKYLLSILRHWFML